ncbi:MAG: transcriptional repressor [Lachnospiraceae bacterium]|nr:transcriptional repressor [Lachnospiraceae bacterium]
MILDAVRGRCDHPTADDIYLELRARDPRISRGTVYRNLKRMAQTGEIGLVQTSPAERFDLRTDPHSHLRCCLCGRVWDAPVPYREEDDRMAEETTGFSVRGHSTVFEGVCADCRKAQEG